MCGIAGLFAGVRKAERRHERLEAMTQALLHRGPDSGGTFFATKVPVGLGHRRLAIVDLDARSTQPMTSKNGRSTIVFNGEIYNYRELATELCAAGCELRTDSDTEVLLEWIERFGIESALERSIGMFAFAVVDEESRTLRLARDRFGKKPLYYGLVDGDFVFASELVSMEAAYAEHLSLDPDAFALLARFSYIPEPFAAYRQVRKLPAGCLLEIGPKDVDFGRVPRPRVYYRLDDVIARGSELRSRPVDAEGALGRLDLLLGDAVRLRLRADVPLGAFLSGGIDSSLVVAYMQEQSVSAVETYSIGYREAEFDESPDARRVASHLGTKHTEFIVGADDVMALSAELATIYDEPFADSSALPSTLVARLARKHVTVVLTGDGGDEIFAGYNRHIWGQRVWRTMEPFSEDFRLQVGSLCSLVSPSTYTRAADLLSPLVPMRFRVRSFGDKMHKFARVAASASPEALHLALAEQFSSREEIFQNSEAKAAFSQFSLPALDLPETLRDLSPLERALRFDTLLGLPGDMLVKVDRATMSVGLEARQPLLDHRVVQLAWELPDSLKFRDGVGKWPLRKLLGRRVPPELFERPKMGFGVPIGAWLRGPLRGFAEELLSARALEETGLFEAARVRALWARHRSGAINADARLWIVLMSQAWLKKRGRRF